MPGYRRAFTRPPKSVKPWEHRLAAKQRYSKGQADCASKTEDDFHGFNVPPQVPQAKPLRVLALFDGISVGLAALHQLGVAVEVYFSCEIDPKAIAVQKHNFGDEITRLGSVTTLTNEKIEALGRIDLLLGGSPCSDLSLVNPKRRGLNDPTSTGYLFFDFKRIMECLTRRAKDRGIVFFWLFENTYAMEKSVMHDISRHLKCSPIVRCASEVTCMKRKRNFWGNIPLMNDALTYAADNNITLQKFLAPGRIATVECLPTLTTTSHSQRAGRCKQYPVIDNGVSSLLFVTEEEKVFGLSPGYTDGGNLSITDRRKLLGKAWCATLIEMMLSPAVVIMKHAVK